MFTFSGNTPDIRNSEDDIQGESAIIGPGLIDVLWAGQSASTCRSFKRELIWQRFGSR